MRHILAPFFTVLQATFQGWGLLLIVPLFWAPLVRWRKEPGLTQRLAWLAALPLPWIMLAYWTSLNWHKDGQPAPVSGRAESLALATLAATAILVLASLILNRDTRWFFGGWGLVNAWFAMVGALLCVMATSGNWI